MTVQQLSSEMDCAELAEWQAFYNLEPFGQSWMQTAMICHTIAHCLCTKCKAKLEDFMPTMERETTGKDKADKLIAQFKMAGMNIIDKRGQFEEDDYMPSQECHVAH